MKGFIITNIDGTIIAVFRDHGNAVHYCHTNSIPTERIKEAEIYIRTNLSR